MKEIGGIIVPIVTPLNDDETLNLGELGNQIERMLDNGVDGIFCFGTNGEGFILNRDEKYQVLKKTIETVNGRCLVYAGTGCISTKETIEQSRMAEELGADVLSIITPSFAKASQEELYQHYKAVASAVDMPILLYNIPARTGNSIAPETVDRLAEISNIVGAKDSSGDWDNLKAYLDVSKKHEGFKILSGNDSLILKSLQEGGAGAIAGCANVYPNVMSSIFDLYQEGRIQEAEVVQNSIASFRSVFKFGNPNTIVKIAVNELGYHVGPCKAPFNELCKEGADLLKKVLAENSAAGMH